MYTKTPRQEKSVATVYYYHRYYYPLNQYAHMTERTVLVLLHMKLDCELRSQKETEITAQKLPLALDF